ncbi:MAG: PIN domain-containing protein [Candidatus Tectimicrobiota bacterium]
MAGQTALVDASVLYAAPVRDLVLELAVSDLFRARWTERINDEWMSHLLANRPDLTAAQLSRTRTLMHAHIRDCLVEGYEPLIHTLTLPDPQDRHVLAAAITAHADVILTYNLTDFPTNTLAHYGMEAQHPDRFLCALLAVKTPEVCAAACRVRARLRNPPLDVAAYLAVLERCGLLATASSLYALSSLL